MPLLRARLERCTLDQHGGLVGRLLVVLLPADVNVLLCTESIVGQGLEVALERAQRVRDRGVEVVDGTLRFEAQLDQRASQEAPAEHALVGVGVRLTLMPVRGLEIDVLGGEVGVELATALVDHILLEEEELALDLALKLEVDLRGDRAGPVAGKHGMGVLDDRTVQHRAVAHVERGLGRLGHTERAEDLGRGLGVTGLSFSSFVCVAVLFSLHNRGMRRPH